jgi:hypothetical protein
MHANTPTTQPMCPRPLRSSVLMHYWEPHWSCAVRVSCAHLQAEMMLSMIGCSNDMITLRNAKAPPHNAQMLVVMRSFNSDVVLASTARG